MDAHAKQIGAAMAGLGHAVEDACTAPDGTRVHFVLLTWTNTGVMHVIHNTPREQCADIMTIQMDLWRTDQGIPGPVQ